MFKIIMAPTDGSDAERPALGVAVTLARRFDAELRLVRVETPPVVVDPRSGPGVLQQTEETVLEARRAREKKLEALADELRKRGAPRVISSLETDRVEPGLRDYANRNGVDLIVMSSHSRGGLKRINLGSVTDYLIRNTDIPTLVVRPTHSAVSGNGSGPFERIAVMLDGSALAEQVLKPVSALISGSNTSVSLVKVLQPIFYSKKQEHSGLPWWEDAVTDAEAYLDLASRRLDNSVRSVTGEVLMGDDVATAILEYCERGNADLLAIATHGVGGIKRLVFGSIADEMTRRAPISVLVFHPRESSG
jgi:nucleotide-binding universal stress UspA family protein